MHELSLMEYSLNAVERRAGEMKIDRVAEVGLVIGRLSIVPAAMEKAFAILKVQRPMFAEARLHLDVRDIEYQCRECGHRFVVKDLQDTDCPICGSNQLELVGGNELLIEYFIPWRNPEGPHAHDHQ